MPVFTLEGYVLQRQWQTVAIFGNPDDLKAIDHIARSFQSDSIPPDIISAIYMSTAGLLAAAFCAIVNALSRRPRLNAGTLGLALTLLGLAVVVIIARSSEASSYTHLNTSFTLPILFFAFLTWRHRRRKRAWLSKLDVTPQQ